MALPMTPQQYADLALQYWQELRALPHDERETRLNEMLLDLVSVPDDATVSSQIRAD